MFVDRAHGTSEAPRQIPCELNVVRLRRFLRANVPRLTLPLHVSRQTEPTDPQGSSPGIPPRALPGELPMDDVIYLVGLVVVVMAILSFFGLR